MRLRKISWKLKKAVVIFLLAYLCIACIRWTSRRQPLKARVVDSGNPNRTRTILIYTRNQGRYDYWSTQSGFIDQDLSGCEKANCRVTFDQSELLNSDVVVFSLFDLKVTLSLRPTLSWLLEVLTFEVFDYYSKDSLPPFKPKGQKWALFWMEPPNILFRYVRLVLFRFSFRIRFFL